LESLPFQLQEEVGQSLALLQKSAREKGLALSCHFGKGVPSAVIGDPMRLRQVILNLVGNALKFTPAGWIRVSVTMAEEIDGGGSSINSSEDALSGSVGVSGGPVEASQRKGAHVIEASTGERKLAHHTKDVRRESVEESEAIQQEEVAETSGRGGGGVAAVEGGPVSYLRPDMASRVVQFEVQDTGIGVPDEARDRIFKAFMQGDSSTSRRYGEKGVSPWQREHEEEEGGCKTPTILLFWFSIRQRKTCTL
jgi:signal transduction histidine kinase